MSDMDMRRFPGRTHRYLQVPPLYAFGHGLSYAAFAYSRLQLGTMNERGLDLRVTVENTGRLCMMASSS